VRESWRDRIRDELWSVVGSNGTPEAVTEALELVGLDDKLHQEARSLSGGEAQRVSFARALAYDPDYLLLDEPTSDLDPRNTALIEEAVREARDRGIGVGIATHDMHQAERIADRVAVILGEGVAEVGSAERVFENPRDGRTAKFVAGELVY
jgi:tungstate transport system ATP-binding protein